MFKPIALALCFIAALLLIASPVAAKERSLPPGNFSDLKTTLSATVEQVINPYTVLLDNRMVLRLAGIDYPDYNPDYPGDFSLMAVKIMKDMLEGKQVNIYQTRDTDFGRSNRMGEGLAHIELQKGGIWVQGAMLRLGLARVMTDERNPEMAAQMYTLEDIARQEKTGIWHNDSFRILDAAETKDYTGSVQLVTGIVRSASMMQNTIYLNFGENWRNDFTIVIPPEKRRNFFNRNIDPLKWNGMPLRVRGWIGNRNGPFIEVTHPERIEVLGKEKKL